MTTEEIWKEYQEGLEFNAGLGLNETVKNNENFFIGKQWEGVKAEGLPTPVFNFIRRIILYLVATSAADDVKLNATALDAAGQEELCKAINGQFECIFEENKMGLLLREFMRGAAVDGDGCLFSYFDGTAVTSSGLGAIRTELVENTRVFFGNPNVAQVEKQPYILLARRESVENLKKRAGRFGGEPEKLTDDGDEGYRKPEMRRATVVHRFWREEKTGTIWSAESTRQGMVRKAWDTGLRRYPIVWMPWEKVKDSYHGQAAVTGLIPNQIFVNKLFAMSMISLMTTAYPKVIYDKSRIPKWDPRAGMAIGVNGGELSSVARTMEPGSLSPQVPQFIQMAIALTKDFMGATDAALGNVRPDNTSAILALQKASGVPMELTRQNLYQALEDLGRIWMDLMRVHYGTRMVRLGEKRGYYPFQEMKEEMVAVKLDVGSSAYWSEIAQLNTLDNLLMTGRIDLLDYLERIPRGYIADQTGLIEKLKKQKEEQEHGRRGI